MHLRAAQARHFASHPQQHLSPTWRADVAPLAPSVRWWHGQSDGFYRGKRLFYRGKRWSYRGKRWFYRGKRGKWWFYRAWAQTPFQWGRLTRLNVWGFVVQWSLCPMLLIFLLFPMCFRSDTSVCSWCNGQGMLTVFHKLTACLSDSYNGHCLPGFWTLLLLIGKAVRLVGPWIPGAWFMLARLTVLPVWRISIDQISFGRCADRLLSSRMLCACHCLCKQFFWESAQLWPSPYTGMLRLLFWWLSLGWAGWCVCAHHGQIHFCLPCAGVAFLARTSRGRVNSCALHSRLDLRASSLDKPYPWPLHKRVLCFGMLCNQVLRPCDLAWNSGTG